MLFEIRIRITKYNNINCTVLFKRCKFYVYFYLYYFSSLPRIAFNTGNTSNENKRDGRLFFFMK